MVDVPWWGFGLMVAWNLCAVWPLATWAAGKLRRISPVEREELRKARRRRVMDVRRLHDLSVQLYELEKVLREQGIKLDSERSRASVGTKGRSRLNFTWERFDDTFRLRDKSGGIWTATDTEKALIEEIERMRDCVMGFAIGFSVRIAPSSGGSFSIPAEYPKGLE